MSPQSITNFYIPTEVVTQSPLFTPDIFPGRTLEILARCRHSRRHSYGTGSAHLNHDASFSNPKKGRSRATNRGLPRPSLTPWNGSTQQTVRILPQRVMTLRSTTTEVQSIWFQSPIEHPEFGVSLTDIVDDGVEKPMVAPGERVFQRIGLNCEEIQFSILWPGYGHISWIASIPINLREGSGYQRGPITRRLLASAVAQHFRAFMTNHSYLRLPHPDPRWRIMNERQNGISFEDLRLTRLFSHKDETGKLGSWQAEILVMCDPSAHTR